MNRLPLNKRAQILGMLVEGNSLRATSRMADVSINTVTKLLVDVGCAVAEYQYNALRNLPCKRVQVDEIWAFCYAKQKNVKDAKDAPEGAGDVWTWTAICADTKLIPSWMVGGRDAEYANSFIEDLASRMASRIQLTSDGHKPYVEAVEGAFGADVDYAMLVKMFGNAPESTKGRYSPADCVGCRKRRVEGNPDEKHVSTSYAERQNLTMRMSMRRFTRLTNGFSKKVENHAHAVALHFMYYNFGRIHKSLRVTPAMAAGVTEHVWTLEEIAGLVKDEVPKKRGSYKKKEFSN
jgi:IS1 family transposase/lambda repressor-like predicted transcriptional regulator